MTNETKQNRRPFLRPGVILVAVLVAVIVVLAVALVVTNSNKNSTESGAPTATTSAPTESAKPEPEPSETTKVSEADKSVCGLKGAVLEKARLTEPPKVENWDYDGTVAYPASKEYGPGATAPEGYRYCFQHSPTGALYAVANTAAQGGNHSTLGDWARYFTAEGPYREKIISDIDKPSSSSSGIRIAIVGFRVLSYDGEKAVIDLAIRGTRKGETVFLSAVTELIWADGDWKLNADTPNPVNTGRIPDTAGYIPWGE